MNLHGKSTTGLTRSNLGNTLLDASFVVVSSAEIAWELEQVAMLREDEMELASRFEERGWTVFALSGVLADPQKVSLGPTTQP